MRATNQLLFLSRTLISSSSSSLSSSKIPSYIVKRSLSSADVQRRLANKSGWKTPLPEDSDYIELPYERLGDTTKVNWELNRHNIVPTGEAFRNLHLRGLQMFCSGKRDESKAVHVEVEQESADHRVVFVDKGDAKTLVQKGDFIPESAYKSLLRDMRQHLSGSKYVFLHDGALGSHRSVESKSRFITNSPEQALFLSHFVQKIPLGAVNEFQYNVVTHLSPNFQSSSLGQSVTVIDLVGNNFILSGTKSTKAIKDALTLFSAHHFLQKGALLLPADAVTHSGRSTLFVDTTFLSSFGESVKKNLAGAHNVIWGSEGVAQAWGGLIHNSTKNLQRGDLVEHNKSSKQSLPRVTVPWQGIGTLSPHPTTVVFFAEDGKTVNSLSASDAVQRLFTMLPPSLQQDAFKAKFEQLLADHKTKVLLVNKKNADAKQQVASIINTGNA